MASPAPETDSFEHSGTGITGLDLRKGNCRYFMIKSWNWDSVLQAQRDGLWVTQEQNEAVFADAFRTCRHVIFFFSVNNSKAFQGYARMESPPGNAPPPSWAASLKWPASKAYRLRWVAKSDTKFQDVSELRNTLNEDMPVLVGRDGQEIDEKCAIALAEMVDSDSAKGKAAQPVGSGGGKRH